MLANYYDFNRADEFVTLFGNLAIGKQPTAERNQYLPDPALGFFQSLFPG